MSIREYQEKNSGSAEPEKYFNQFIQSKIFADLGITEKEEQRCKQEALPEGAPEVLREARERSFENIREMTKTFFSYFQKKGKKPEDIFADLRVKLDSVRKNAFIGFNECGEHISEVLRAGEIKPVFWLSPEHKSRSTTGDLYSSDMKMRLRIEEALGFKKMEHPVSLALGSERDRERGPAPHYGAFHFSFPLDNFRQRAICILGDSLNRLGVPFSLRDELLQRGDVSTEKQAQHRELTLEHGLLAKAMIELDSEYEPKQGAVANYVRAINYIEVQVLDPVNVDGAKELVFSRYGAGKEIEVLAKKFRSLSWLGKVIEKERPNLSFRVAGEPPADIKKYFLYQAYEKFFRKPAE